MAALRATETGIEGGGAEFQEYFVIFKWDLCSMRQGVIVIRQWFLSSICVMLHFGASTLK